MKGFLRENRTEVDKRRKRGEIVSCREEGKQGQATITELVLRKTVTYDDVSGEPGAKPSELTEGIVFRDSAGLSAGVGGSVGFGVAVAVVLDHGGGVSSVAVGARIFETGDRGRRPGRSNRPEKVGDGCRKTL